MSLQILKSDRRKEEESKDRKRRFGIRRSSSKRSKKSIYAFALFAALWVGLSIVALAAVLDNFGPPPPGDPSAFTGPLIGKELAIDFLATLLHANEGGLEGGNPGANNAIPKNRQRTGGKFDVPTGGKPSPLFGAHEFEQQMLRDEEFGTEPLPARATPGVPFPAPTVGPLPEQDPNEVGASAPAGAALDAFLAQPGISPFPSKFANEVSENPWKPQIEAFLGRALDAAPAEGRPAGKGWSHQRWNEFFPQVFFKTAQAGSQENGGFRDRRQLHRYTTGEWGPGGLYHRVYESSVPGSPTLDGSTRGLKIRFHPRMPVQDHKALWTFDGTLPPKLLMVRYGQAVLMCHYNALPIDPAANRGFGLHTITTHEHNGHTPAESDGYTNAFFFPGQFYDYRWPIQLAGYDPSIRWPAIPGLRFPVRPGRSSSPTISPSG